MTKIFWPVLAFTFGLAVGDSACHADVIFGSETPTPACSAPAVGAEGSVCSVTETFSQAVATETGGAALTLKTVATAGFQDSGLGVAATATACDDAMCEAETGQTVTISASPGFRIHDAIVASVDTTSESFTFFADGQQIDGVIAGTVCNAPGFTISGITCVWNDPTGNGVGSISVTDVTGSIVVSEVSTTATTPSVSEPSTLALLLSATAGLGFLGLTTRRRKSGFANV